MLSHAFETMVFDKVEFRIDERIKNRDGLLMKIGAILEGILRKNTLMQDGYKRSTCCYGILKEEWAAVKARVFKDLSSVTTL